MLNERNAMKREFVKAYRRLTEEGIGSFMFAVRRWSGLKLEVFIKGRKPAVYIDGCRFGLRDLPNTVLKLALVDGTYEQPEREAIQRYLSPELPVVEMGGCIGVVSCITNKLLKNPTAHVVLEANPFAVPYLQSNRDANGCSFKILNRAVAYDSDSITFAPLLNYMGSSLHQEGDQRPVTVKSVQLASIIREEQFQEFSLICDIEGQEFDLVMHESEVLRGARLIIMEIHPHMIGEEKVQALMSKLESLGFEKIDQSSLVVVLSNTLQKNGVLRH